MLRRPHVARSSTPGKMPTAYMESRSAASAVAAIQPKARYFPGLPGSISSNFRVRLARPIKSTCCFELFIRDVDGSLEPPLLVEPHTERGEKTFVHSRLHPGQTSPEEDDGVHVRPLVVTDWSH